MAPTIYTIGHSNHTWESFAPLLRQHGIEVLVDVRSRPVSRFAPFANRRSLEGLLEKDGIEYAYIGDALGGKPKDPSLLDAHGRPDYARMQSMSPFREGIEELARLAEDARTAIMCAEEDPLKCHRRLLIGPALEGQGADQLHIRKDGSVQRSEELGKAADGQLWLRV